MRALLVVCLLTAPALADSHKSLATSYTHMIGPNAKWNGDVFYCAKKPGTNKWAAPGTRGYRRVRMNGNEAGVAHRRLPCGTMVAINRGGRLIVVPVVDRGPYWQVPEQCFSLTQTRRWGKAAQSCWKMGRPGVKLRKGYRFATDLDLTRRVGLTLRLGGRGLVRWRVTK